MNKSANIADIKEPDSFEKEKWSRKAEYVLSVLGFIVGLGNLWRFPYICMRNGGGAFLIPFIFFLVFCGLPLFYLELAIGQFSGKGFVHVWEVCPLFKGIGYAMLLLGMIVNVYYNMIIAWTLYYIGNSFISPLPWTTCDNEWNTPNCLADRRLVNISSVRTGYFNGSLLDNNTAIALNDNQSLPRLQVTAQDEFWHLNVLQASSGFEEIGYINWHLLLCLLGAWVIIGLCVMKGVKSVGKVVYVTALLPYILLTVILVRGLTLDGSINGVIKYLRPDFSKLLHFQVWIEAAVQVFYSLSPGWGMLISMASCNKFNNNILKDSIMLTFMGEGTSIYCGLVIFTVVGFMATKLQLPMETIVQSGPGLGFIVYPEALTYLPGQNVWACIFFIMLFSTGLDSMFAFSETCIGAFTDSFPSIRRRRVLFTALFCGICFVLGIIFCTQGGIYVFQIIDWYSAAYAITLIGFLECVIFGWIYGLDRLSQDVHLMTGRGLPAFFRICISFVTPTILLMLTMSSFLSYQPPTYGTYIYPTYASVIGITISVSPILLIVGFAFNTIRQTQGVTLYNKLQNSLRPSIKWVPVCQEIPDDYQKERDVELSVFEKFKLNLKG